ncbi:MAG TPA: tRNA epoxyqueuosine(34) reductase QueG, partial [Thermoanaerobaculia bacterium]|nr:tRNA epoxyqueuosine(34) reductase QueG [Thermoanaerobaculia bacterium]
MKRAEIRRERSSERSALLKRWALEAGFDRAGAAVLGPSEQGEAYREWLERGDQAGMAYLERRVEERLDPRKLLPGAKSALCVTWRYAPLAGEGPEAKGDLWPGVALYARGDDYHDLILGRLRRLSSKIEEAFPGTKSRAYVDTGPVLERELAARAGLGWQGKNTCLLHPKDGSYFFLAEILLTLDLAPAPPVADLCGSCTRCLEACPTGALPEPYRLDSRRCISYWTIEHRGEIPEEVREWLGQWIFGCDICQQACPWNWKRPRPIERSDRPELSAPERRADLDLIGLLRLSREEYVERFRGSALKRAKLEGLKRNAAIAMGNRGDQRYVPALTEATSDENPTVRFAADWALRRG